MNGCRSFERIRDHKALDQHGLVVTDRAVLAARIHDAHLSVLTSFTAESSDEVTTIVVGQITSRRAVAPTVPRPS
ncbi:hypothetical protein P9209_04970 [Prescottella defluvii]|nr:hypothetical protein P9209_04970 [Prescottella defluvii]